MPRRRLPEKLKRQTLTIRVPGWLKEKIVQNAGYHQVIESLLEDYYGKPDDSDLFNPLIKDCPYCKTAQSLYPMKGNLERRINRQVYIMADAIFYKCITCDRVKLHEEIKEAEKEYLKIRKLNDYLYVSIKKMVTDEQLKRVTTEMFHGKQAIPSD